MERLKAYSIENFTLDGPYIDNSLCKIPTASTVNSYSLL